MNIASTPRVGESKHDKFLRLMQNRLSKALEKIRLVSQLSSENYENTLDEAYEVVGHLDDALKNVAHVFNVPYSSVIGVNSTRSSVEHKVDEIDIAKAIDLIRAGHNEEAIKLLRSTALRPSS